MHILSRGHGGSKHQIRRNNLPSVLFFADLSPCQDIRLLNTLLTLRWCHRTTLLRSLFLRNHRDYLVRWRSRISSICVPRDVREAAWIARLGQFEVFHGLVCEYGHVSSQHRHGDCLWGHRLSSRWSGSECGFERIASSRSWNRHCGRCVLVDCDGWVQICHDLSKVSKLLLNQKLNVPKFGPAWILTYCRYVWIFPLIVYIALCAVGGKYFEIPPPAGTQSTANKGGLALSYLSLQIGSGLGWAAVSADYVGHP